MMFLPRPPSSWPGLNPPEGRGGFCASNLFSMLTLMSLAKVKNASSTFILALAEVSMNFIPYSIANCSPRSLETCLLYVTLVAKDHLLHISAGVLLDVPDPVLDVVEALLVGDVVLQHDPHGSSVVGGGNGSESLLSRSVPDLQLDL